MESRSYKSPLVALIGAPNVGKSTLFNRLVGRRRSIVTDSPGVTRDRIYGTVRSDGGAFRLCDTGGLVTRPDPDTSVVLQQTGEAIAEADLLVFVVDGRRGLTPLDEDLARILHAKGKPVLLAVNKLDTPGDDPAAAEFHRLGFGDPQVVSAEHGLGIADLLDRVEALLGPLPDTTGEGEDIVVAVAGRPNVGKSSLLNRLVGGERFTVSPRPGTTRDAVDVLIEREGRRYRLFDTAGIRRRGRPKEKVEVISEAIALRSLGEADVVCLLLDGASGITAQDQHVAGHVAKAARPLIVVVNKWDLVSEAEEGFRKLQEEVAVRFRFARYAPLLTVSALTGQRVDRLLPLVDRVDRAARKRIPTTELNRFLSREMHSGRGVKLQYMTQTADGPPAFTVFTHDAGRVHFSLRRRLENRLREAFDLGPTPVILRFRSRGRRRRG